MWLEPKTDWVITDYFNYSDYNRIKNNIAYLRELALSMYTDFPFFPLGNDKNSYEEYPYADEFNAIEIDLELIKNNTFDFYNTEQKEWYENQRTPNYEDFNRLESACLSLYKGLNTQKSTLGRLSFRLGTRQSTIKV